MRLLFLLFTTLLIFIPVRPAEAQVPTNFKTANDLVQLCQDKKPVELKDPAAALAFGFCHGIFQGLLASSAVSTLFKPLNLGTPLFCAPSTVTPHQAKKIFLKWMDEHPEELHENPMVAAVISLMRAFPCKGDD